MTQNLLCRPGWTQIHTDFLVPASQGPRLKACATISGYYVIFNYIFNYVYMCAFPCGYVHMSTKEARGVRSPGVGVAVMRHPMWVLEMEFESSRR